MKIEQKQISATDVEFKDGIDGGPPRARVRFSTFDNWDLVRPIPERPVRGAFKKYLPRLIKSGFSSVNHDMQSLPVATVEDAGEDDRGAWAEIAYHTTAAALDAYTVAKQRYERGKDVAASFAYIVHKDEYVSINDDEELKEQGITRGRELKELEVKEIGFVTAPANPKAGFTSLKTLLPDGMTFQDQLDATLELCISTKERYADLSELRTKEGRAINAQRRARLAAIADALDALDAVRKDIRDILAETEPAPSEEEAPKSLADGDVEHAQAEQDEDMSIYYARFYARKQGVAIP